MTMSRVDLRPGDSGVRRALAADRDQLYDVCLRTGDSGRDASGLYQFPHLLGDVFVGPYLALQPDLALVVDRGNGIEGYILGALDSGAFSAACDRHWWPQRRRDYADVYAAEGTREAWLLEWIDTPPVAPAFAADYPSHLHIDLLPSLRRGGWGRRLVALLLETLDGQGSHGVHLGVARDNTNAIGFYHHLGFVELDGDDHTLWLGQRLS